MDPRWRSRWLVLTFALGLFSGTFSAGPAFGLDFPGPTPGAARGRIDGPHLALENETIALTAEISQERLRLVGITDKLSGKTLPLGEDDGFQVVLSESPLPKLRTFGVRDLKVVGKPKIEHLKADHRVTRAAEHCEGKQLTVELVSPDGSLGVQWQAILRDGSNYVRERVTVKANRQPLELKQFVLLELAAPDARVAGAVDGSPVVAGNMFFGCENPMATSEILAGASDGPKRFRCSYASNSLIRPGGPVSYTAVAGVAPEGQLRRGLLYYLERERAQPYRPFLHYNNGSEIGCEYWQRKLKGKPGEAEQFRRGQEEIWLKNIRAFGEELVAKRGVVMDSFVHDFEWDNELLVWQFHEGYPHGFGPAQQTAKKYHARVGVWLSPNGGYPCKPGRIEGGTKLGFEMNANGLSLAGPRYYARVRTVCANMIREFGVNYFKYDGFGWGNSLTGAGQYRSDVEALLRMMDELRALEPTVFFNPSTGTWPSPFWLRWSDSIWRQGSDTSVQGKGSDRQRWITYRDGEICHGVLDKCPLYPVSSLMIHGIYVNALPLFADPYNPASPRPSYAPAEIIAEIRSFFGTGTNLQEMYIAPNLMTRETWDALAEAARWSRAHADVLVDTHKVGGDPAKGEVYGWASWSRRRAILMLRNPDDRPAEIVLDLAKAFELPKGAPERYVLKSPWKEDAKKPGLELSAGERNTFALRPFEVLTFDAVPTTHKNR